MTVTNLVALQFAMGYQGGTIHQMAKKLRVDTSDILNANDERMDDLLRRAQGLHVGKDYIKNLLKALEKAHAYLSKAQADGLLEGCILPLSQVIDRLHPDAIPEDCDHDGLCLGSSPDDEAKDDCLYLTGGLKP